MNPVQFLLALLLFSFKVPEIMHTKIAYDDNLTTSTSTTDYVLSTS